MRLVRCGDDSDCREHFGRWRLDRFGERVCIGRDRVRTNGYWVLVEGQADDFLAIRVAGVWTDRLEFEFTRADADRMLDLPPRSALKLASKARLALSEVGCG